MQICVAMMSVADCVAFIPDWEESRGAQVEYAWCKYVGKPMMGLQGGGGSVKKICERCGKAKDMPLVLWIDGFSQSGYCENP